MSVHFEVDEQVAAITINRPEVANAIDRPTADAPADSYCRFEGDFCIPESAYVATRAPPGRWPSPLR